MTFEDYWAEVEQMKALPDMAIRQLPAALKADTKKKLMEKAVEETARLLSETIEEINHGSVKSNNSLVKERL